MTRLAAWGALALAFVLGGAPARAGGSDWLRFSGYVQSDLRYVIEDWRGDPGDGYRFEMNRNDLDLRLEILPYERVQAVVDARLRFYGFDESARLDDLYRRDLIDPWSLHLDEAFVAVQGLGWDKLDLALGRMVRTWGTVDQFNPTDNLNARDFSDPLDYTAKIPNQMIELTAYPADWLTLTAVFVPVFKPSQLPPSGRFYFGVERDAGGCFRSAPVPPLAPSDVKELEGLFSAIDACSLNFADPLVVPLRPEVTIENSQAAFKAAFQVWEIDVSFSYYYGRFTFPVAYTAVADVNLNPTRPGVFDVAYTAEVIYPRMPVAGFDWSFPLSFSDWFEWDTDFSLGFFGEVAVIFPEEVVFGLRAYQGGAQVVDKQAVNVASDPFVKASVAMDYTFAWGTYLNAMYVRGFFDEFNDLYGVHDYVVLALEQKWLSDSLSLRLAGALNVNDQSATTFPELKWIPYPGVELSGGVLWFVGDTEPADPYDYGSKSKFGMKATGRNVAFLKARGSW